MVSKMKALTLEDPLARVEFSAHEGAVRIEAVAQWFHVRLLAPLEMGEMETLAERLRELDAAQAGAYRFVPARNWGEIVFAMAKKGELHVSVRLQSAPDFLNEVRVFLNLRQEALPSIADGFAELEGK